jgi:hypothetical protein
VRPPQLVRNVVGGYCVSRDNRWLSKATLILFRFVGLSCAPLAFVYLK